MEPGQTNNPHGRPKGSLNKKNQEIQELAKELNCNPAKILMLFALRDHAALNLPETIEKASKTGELYEELSISADMQMNSANALMPYLYGKRKPIDSNGDDSRDALDEILDAIDGTK